MDILSDDQYKVLGFISACNRCSYHPTAEQVMLWLENPEPRKAQYRTVRRPSVFDAVITPPASSLGAWFLEPAGSTSRMIDSILGLSSLNRDARNLSQSLMEQFAGSTYQERVADPESLIDHLVRLTWLVAVPGRDDTMGFQLTELGNALLRHHEMDSQSDEDVSVVVLEGNDPLAYPVLVRWLFEAGEGLLIDPYLKLEYLDTLVEHTRLTRVLVSAKPGNRGVVASMQTYLASNTLRRRNIEVRMSAEAHDRCLLAENGALSTLGTSLNSIGRTTTVMTPISSPALETLRRDCERLWREAELVGPPRRDGDDESEAEPVEPAKKASPAAKKAPAKKAPAKKAAKKSAAKKAPSKRN